ncbi:hypothetical protein [Neptunitalea lumnitzerae]|uniref:Uncharacterized protein n=1 Tax=Neptunitalea lumnitzerae TaxID=2965509 RepID=A0ABQ5MIM0_9FLAO|nr:hypothetical protein [Neptunitalea sp. Y10]GLB49266.1 hypothetical protein Y10_16340 [Neptunitalea sp. Y10]
MLQIIADVKPKEGSEWFGKALGAYATIFIDYKDVDGAYALFKFYLEDEEWEITEMEEDYEILDSIENVEEDYKELYEEAEEYGYAIMFNVYEEE